MAEKFELKTRHQFSGLIERRDRWVRIKDQPEAQARFEELTGPDWTRQDQALDAGAAAVEVQDPSRALQLPGRAAAVQTIFRFAREKEFLSGADLLELHRVLFSGVHARAGEFRTQDSAPLAEGHEPTEAELVTLVVDNALTWFQSESFAEMHEVEKSGLMLIKLMDVQPFEEENGQTIRMFSNFFLLKAGYPPAVIPADQSRLYAVAIQRSLRLDTQPIIDLIADATERSLRWCLGEPPAPLKFKVLAD